MKRLIPVTLLLVVFPAESAARLTDADIRDKVTAARPYRLDTEIQVVLSEDQGIRLDIGDNPYGFKECILYWDSSGALGSEPAMHMLFFDDGGNVLTRGSSSVPRHKGYLKQVARLPYLAIATWTVTDGKLSIDFCISSDKQKNQREYERCKKINDEHYQKTGLRIISFGFVNDAALSPRKFTELERLGCFIRLWSEIKYNFAFFDQVPEVDWDEVLTEYLPKVQKEQTGYEFCRLMTRCVAQLCDGHTNFYPGPASPPEILGRPPVLVHCVERKAIIVEFSEAEELQEARLKRGMEITHVDGRAVREILEEDLYPYITASTPQARDQGAYPKLLQGPIGSVASVQVRDMEGKSRTVKLTRTVRGGKRSWRPEKRWGARSARKAGELSDGIFYVPLDSFASREIVEEFDKLFEEVQKAKGLILDVRSNGGGNSAFGDAILGYLTDKPLKNLRWKTRQYMPAFRAWGEKEKWHEGEHRTIEPIKHGSPFLGPVVVLIGPRTFSAAEDFLIPLHYSGRATLVGQRTAGSTGQPLLVDLPAAAKVRICTKRDTYPDGREYVGVGVIPDVEVVPTQEDVAAGRYANDRDPVLEKGLEVLKKQLQP